MSASVFPLFFASLLAALVGCYQPERLSTAASATEVRPLPPPPLASKTILPEEFLTDFENSSGEELRSQRSFLKSDTSNCNDEHLRFIIISSIEKSLAKSKSLIAERAKRDLGGRYDVICTDGTFSYFIAASRFCQETVENVSCVAYRLNQLDAVDLNVINENGNDGQIEMNDE
ncbi:unnamed protein product [Caenorhabditis auriculariae]|uniref:Ground-like domain-containing protein n=1 Tax=Caenorhabditis auriculariae TaxID=2777116 RepID=A0A8S1HIG5_9PELO|nr:unnamed protein product [Caenorhabditis auriculariae]